MSLKVCLLTGSGNNGVFDQVRRGLGDEVEVRETLTAVVVAIHQSPVDVVILCLGPKAPPLFETIDALRYLLVPVIVLCDDDTQGEESRHAGADDYITTAQLASDP